MLGGRGWGWEVVVEVVTGKSVDFVRPIQCGSRAVIESQLLLAETKDCWYN